MNNKPTYISKDGLEKLRQELEELVSAAGPRSPSASTTPRSTATSRRTPSTRTPRTSRRSSRAGSSWSRRSSRTHADRRAPHERPRPDRLDREGQRPDGSQTFTIVGSTEAKPTEGKISNESPVGRALLGKKKGENVTGPVPAGDIAYKIVSIT
jgi:transcription elongation factor GreA